MSSTYTVGKLAAAFRGSSERIMYVLFEQTYESNVFPRTPRWSCIFIGSIEGALQRIFGRASDAEGGCLRNRADNLTPESYIAAWLKQFAAPVNYQDHSVLLEVGKNFYAAINDENRAEVRQVFETHGRHDLARQAEEGKPIDLSLYGDCEMIAALVSEASVSPWRLIRDKARALTVPDPSLGFKPAAARSFDVHLPAFLRVDGDEVLMQRADGSWYRAGWQYRVVADYVEGLWRAELSEPGSYRKRIDAYRQAVKSAPTVPHGAKVVVDLTVPLEDWQRRNVEEVRQALTAKTTASGFEAVVDLADKEAVWQACHLPAVCTTWVLPASAAAAPSAPTQRQESLGVVA